MINIAQYNKVFHIQYKPTNVFIEDVRRSRTGGDIVDFQGG